MLSRPPCDPSTERDCEICTIAIDLPRTSGETLREEQLADPNLKNIIKCFEASDTEQQVTPTSFEVAATNKPTISVGKFHVSALRHFIDDEVLADHTPVRPIQGRGRPRKSPRINPTTPGDDERFPHAISHPSSSRAERQKRIPRRFRDGMEYVMFRPDPHEPTESVRKGRPRSHK
ncbi:hypothetical protein JTB14_020349 [Gonioctena quinquepunctata]|nr:hypothetical protein JTB14_020349 [Gonioctena quinquepunctata]